VFFCGHRIAGEGQPGGLPADAEARCAAAISEVVGSRPAGFAYGALAGGADILWAEALLARGSELYVVLPFAVDEFIKSSVAPCGFGWVERFGRLLGAAAEVRYATDDALLGDDVLFRYGGELGMGLALLRARYLDAEARQFALWDGGPPAGAAGTAFDVATWRSSGHPATIVSPEGRIANCEPGVTPIAPSVGMPAPNRRQPRRDHSERAVRAMLFGDFRGFSKLTDEQLPRFTERILGTVAEVVRAHRDQVLYRNTWGDAVYLVLTDVAAAADCALDFQEALAAIDLSSEDLPDHLALRLGGHVGPVFQAYDPVLENDGFMGSHVSRTARIEPVAPPGTVYVTEAFAAALVLAANRDMTCDYVGHMSAAKGYGRLRMYRLRRTAGGDDWRP
jgi:class 3 adenylate cyclase